ncbi:condensation domain-containing protein, partial [Roseibium sp. RKSG952]|uniref:condensation domain-containing protein n=1 Tax=Roseibium sp. RKSG952 TaxID=2529384 RepID=UPI0012BD7D61
VGTPVAGRLKAELEGVCGLFVNTVALRHRVDPELSFEAHLKEVKDTVLAAFAHDGVPFEAVVEAIAPARSLSHAPI